jgi:hypothetical protein
MNPQADTIMIQKKLRQVSNNFFPFTPYATIPINYRQMKLLNKSNEKQNTLQVSQNSRISN